MRVILICLWSILLLPVQVPAEKQFSRPPLPAALTDNGSPIFAAAALTWLARVGVDIDALILFGSQSIIGPKNPMTPSISFRTNTLSEIFIDMTVAYLEKQGVFPFSRSQPIPRRFLPPPFDTSNAFYNPLYPNVVVSLSTLLLHTSSITEVEFSTGTAQTPGPVTSITTFVEKVLANSGTSGFWGAAMPGLSGSYQHSRLNSALVTYILEKVFEEIGIPEKSLATFVQNTFIAEMGLQGTFLVNTEGKAPAPTYPPNSAPSFSKQSVQDVMNDGKTVANSVLIHAAYSSDYMYYTTVMDLAKLAGEVFLGGKFESIGPMLLNDTIKLPPSSSSSGNMPGIVSRSLGVYGFSTEELCRIASLRDDCPLDDGTIFYGWIVGGEYNQVAMICTTVKCVAAEVSFPSSRITSFSSIVGLAISPFIESIPPLEGGGLYALYVFIGVIGTIIVVIVLSYIGDHVIRPAPPAAPISSNKASLPVNMAVIGGVGAMMGTTETDRVQDVPPPVRHLNMYD